MAKVSFSQESQSEGLKRWEKLLQQPGHTGVWDMSTGEKYRIEQFIPIYDDNYKTVVNQFKIKGTNETVYVPFLRLLTDGVRCSLMKKP